MTASDSYDPLAELKAALGEGSPELAAGLMDLFIEDTPARLEALRTAMEESDFEAFRHTALIIKRSAQTVDAPSICMLAKLLEELGQSRHWEGAEFLCCRLEDEFLGLCRKRRVRLEDSAVSRITGRRRNRQR